MPRGEHDVPAPKPACDVEKIYRQWKDSPHVRVAAIKSNRLFVSSKGRDHPVKVCIKEASYNKLILTPILILMADNPSHPLPCIKDIAREKPGAFMYLKGYDRSQLSNAISIGLKNSADGIRP